jgi:Putative adhesin
MKHWIPACALVLALGTLPALASEATFERTLSVSGTVTLHISTGSGFIHIKPGSDNQVHIFGRVKSNGFENREERVREIAANPPIEQTGSILRVGSHLENLHNISIDYEIQAPAKTLLEANTGSGDVTDTGVGMNARLNTGSGTIHATGLNESFSVETGSGDIYAEQTGTGDVKAHTGSGTIELKNISGGLKAETGSGDIKLSGQPKADWRVNTGSGSVELWAERSAFTLEASTGSGDIKTDREMAVQGSFEKHHITGKINGGGPLVKVETGSGDIRVH